MEKQTAPRLKDVAQEADVSLTSASRILRGEGQRYSQETRQRVLTAAQKLNWRRNLLVSGMQTGQTKTIGVMIPPFDSFWVDVIDGIHATLAEADYLPVTVWPRGWRELGAFEDQKEEGHLLISRLLDRRVDALILWPAYAVAYCEHFPELSDRRVPVGVIEHNFADQDFGDVVSTDELLSAAEVANLLYQQGHRRIACLSSREIEAHTWAIERREAFEAALKSHEGIAFRSWRLNLAGDNGSEVANELLTSSFAPTAVFCVTDHEARFVYEQARRLGISIPQQLSVVGFVGLDFAMMMTPPLTTMRIDGFAMARTICSQLLDRLAKPKSKTRHTRIAAKLLAGESVSGPPIDA